VGFVGLLGLMFAPPDIGYFPSLLVPAADGEM
jgi:hypothetical protein